MKRAILLLLLLLIPTALALDCDWTSDPDYCNEVKGSELSDIEKDLLFSSLLYGDSKSPLHSFVEDYNKDIGVIDPPDNTTLYHSRQIRNAWLSLLNIFPSVYENNTLYVSNDCNVLSAYDYNVHVPSDYSTSYPETIDGDCKRTHSLTRNTAVVSYMFNDNLVSLPFEVNTNGEVKVQLDISTQIKREHYEWERYCCRWNDWGCVRYCYKCEYDHISYENDNLRLSESKEVVFYDKQPSASVKIVNEYYNVTKGLVTADNYSLFTLSFNESFLTEQAYAYSLVFEKKPYYFAYIKAELFEKTVQKNLYAYNGTFVIKNAEECHLDAYNHFNSFSSECDLTLYQEDVEQLELENKNIDLSLLFYLLLFILFVFLIYKLVRSQFRKFVIPVFFIFLLLVPTVMADPVDDPDECGLTNLASCIPQKMYEYLLVVINAPLLPLLAGIQSLLTAEVSIDIFYHVWSIVRYILSFFYLFFFIYAGYTFLTSSANPIKRGQAKDLLKNTFLMIIFIQASFYIYQLVLAVGSSLTSSILPMINPHFFMLTADNITNIGLEFMFAFTYGITLFLTLLMLVLRYIIVAFGVVLFPLGIFLFFIPPLKGYGKFILNILGIFIFITFIDLLIILSCSMLIEIPLFENFKILVMITCFGIVNYSLWLAIKFALKKSSFSNVGDQLNQAVKYIALAA